MAITSIQILSHLGNIRPLAATRGRLAIQAMSLLGCAEKWLSSGYQADDAIAAYLPAEALDNKEVRCGFRMQKSAQKGYQNPGRRGRFNDLDNTGNTAAQGERCRTRTSNGFSRRVSVGASSQPG